MTEKTRKILVFSSLPVALIWAYFTLSSRKTVMVSPVTVDPALTTIPLATKTPATSTVNDSSRLAAVRAETWGVDPFRGRSVMRASQPTIASPIRPSIAASGPSFALGGIIYSESSPIAYVNGQLVKVGDKVNSAKVISIERRTVTLDLDGHSIKISLSKEAQS